MPFTKKRPRSPSTTPLPTTEDASQVPDQEWDAMSRVLNAIYDYRTQDDYDPSILFHRRPNKRVLPDYYETIKEPVALSTIKQKIMKRNYQNFAEFVRDFALIPHNAQVYNRSGSGAFQDALVVKEQIEKNLQQLVEEGLITKEVALLPDLGEIPTYEEAPPEENEEDEEESEEEGEEDEEDEDEDAGNTAPRRKRGRPSLHKREPGGEDEGSKKTRGRPPKLLTPMEARIQAVLKGIRKPKNNRSQHLIRHFERPPDKMVTPEYYAAIKTPMAYDMLKRKVKRKKYPSLEAFMADVNLMFDNAKAYNTDESQIHQDAVTLQVEAGRLYDIEKAKSDSMFVDDDGKIPMPEGVLRNGELYKVGDWVHIQNPNDLTKPIPAQVYRTYRNQNGQAMVNVCWYYRPEQTVHRFDKHFFDHEVVKTGRYRDHHIEEIEGRCFVMFTTRFFKGRPRGLPEGTELYVCEARYNEEKHQFNKIKTWASCLPDEVRDRDYEMDLYDHPKRMKKLPSPIKYLLKDEQLETDELPKPTWGADGAPPKIGAVHRRPRTDRDSPPPEPTPPPAPKLPTPPPRQIAQPALQSSQPQNGGQRPAQTMFKQSFGPMHPGSYAHSPVSAAPLRTPSSSSNAPLTPHQSMRPSLQNVPSNYGQATTQGPISAQQNRPAVSSASSYRDPPPIETYILPDQANLSVPPEIRQQYRCDDYGRILFFTAPPVVTKSDPRIAHHSVRYLAEKTRRKAELAEKRKRREEQLQEAARQEKRRRAASEEQMRRERDRTKDEAFAQFCNELRRASKDEISEAELSDIFARQHLVKRAQQDIAMHDVRRDAARRHTQLAGTFFADDLNTRVA